jgi:hypothetical protein
MPLAEEALFWHKEDSSACETSLLSEKQFFAISMFSATVFESPLLITLAQYDFLLS